MQTKKKRLQKILELIDQFDIETQEDLAEALRGAGFNVTQATVSRDIKALHLEKVSDGKRSRYVFPKEKESELVKYRNVLKDSYLSMAQAANLVVIKTVAGMAMAAAAALDHLNLEEVVGTLGGDDTIMCATRSDEDAQRLIERIREIVK